MATYLELRNLFNDGDLMNRTIVAIVVEAQILIDGTPTTTQKAWANHALANPKGEARKTLGYMLAVNRALTPAAILSASDVALQSNVADTIAVLVDALAGV